MAQPNKTATVQKEASENQAGGLSEKHGLTEQVAANREAIIASMTFDEFMRGGLKSARWRDVLAQADALARYMTDSEFDKKAFKTPTAAANAVAKSAPTLCAQFRFALMSYCLGKGTEQANTTQQAELSGKLPWLRTDSKVNDRKIDFAGIVIPPFLGSI